MKTQFKQDQRLSNFLQRPGSAKRIIFTWISADRQAELLGFIEGSCANHG